MDRASKAAEQWTKERPGLDTGPMVLLRRLGEATLRRSGRPYALTPTALYEAAMISSGSMTNRIDRLEKAGLVERSPNPPDRRSTLVALTTKGFGLVDEATHAHVANQAEVVAGLSAAEQAVR